MEGLVGLKEQSISIEMLSVGMVFTAPLTHPRFQIILPQNFPVFRGFIEECAALGITQFFCKGSLIDDPEKYPSILPGYVSLELRKYIQKYYDSVQILKKQFADPKELRLSELQRLISQWLSNTDRSRHTQIYFQVIRYTILSEKDYFYGHLLDVMLMSIAIYNNYRKETSSVELIQLGMSALLYDIGMILLPDYIKFHTEEYDEAMQKQVKMHPVLGFRFLTSILKTPSSFAYPALEHHERIDGSGYPYGIKGENMHENSIIISLADIFTSQVRLRPYRNQKEPCEILKDFVSTTLPIFQDKSRVFVQAFISYLSVYPITSFVLLSTGEVAIVTEIIPMDPLHPNVMVLLNKDGAYCNQNFIYRLSMPEHSHIKISGTYGYEHLKKLTELYPTPVFEMKKSEEKLNNKESSKSDDTNNKSSLETTMKFTL